MISETDIEFLHTVWRRRPFFTYVFFGINIAVFILMSLAGGSSNESTLLAFGVKSNGLINQGQYWRFVTPIFIHIGFLHLFFNSYALWMVGPQVERLYGGARFVLLYVVTGVAGVIGSYVFRPENNSAGASGAIFGLFGVLFAFGLRYRHNIPSFFRTTVGTGVLPVIVINLIIGFTIPMIDNAAHIAGLLAGATLAIIVPFERPRTKTPMLFTTIQIALIGLIVASAYEVFANYDGPQLAIQNIYQGWRGGTGVPPRSEQFKDALNDTQDAFNDSLRALSTGDRQSVDTAITKIAKAIDELKDAPSLGKRADAITADLLIVLQDHYELMRDVQRSGTTTLMHAPRVSNNVKKYDEIQNALHAWVEEEGERYGIQLRKPR